jgi:hypothetical protein
MKWGFRVPGVNFSVTYEIGDEFVQKLHVEKGGGDTGAELRPTIEFEYFLMSANRYRMAVLDEQTLSYIIMNYDSEKEKILKVFKDLMQIIGKHDDNPTTDNNKNQSELVADTNETIHIQGS